MPCIPGVLACSISLGSQGDRRGTQGGSPRHQLDGSGAPFGFSGTFMKYSPRLQEVREHRSFSSSSVTLALEYSRKSRQIACYVLLDTVSCGAWTREGSGEASDRLRPAQLLRVLALFAFRLPVLARSGGRLQAPRMLRRRPSLRQSLGRSATLAPAERPLRSSSPQGCWRKGHSEPSPGEPGLRGDLQPLKRPRPPTSVETCAAWASFRNVVCSSLAIRQTIVAIDLRVN